MGTLGDKSKDVGRASAFLAPAPLSLSSLFLCFQQRTVTPKVAPLTHPHLCT